MSGIKSELLEAIETQADRMDEKAREFPDDLRNARSAAALRALHTRLAAVPEDSPLLQKLERLWSRAEDRVAVRALAAREREIVRAYGWGAGAFTGEARGNPNSFLRHLIRQFEDEVGTSEPKGLA